VPPESEWKPSRLPLMAGIAATVAVAGLLGVGFILSRSRAARLNPGNAPRVGYLETSALGRRRHASSIHWDDIDDHAALFLRDLVFTPPEATASVVLDDLRRIALPPGSMVELDEQTFETMKIRLIEPEQQMLAAVPATDGLVWVTDPKVWEWRQSELIDRAKKLSAKTTTLASLVPLNRMSRGPLRPVLEDFEIRLLPAVQMPGQRVVRLRWTPVPVDGVRYEVQIGDTPTLETATVRSALTNQLNLPLSKAGSYYWRSLAYDGASVLSSEMGAFTFGGAGKVTAFDPARTRIEMVGSTKKARGASIEGQGANISVQAERVTSSVPGLDKTQIDRVVKRRSFEVKPCLDGFQGKVFLTFRILGSGAVDGVKIDAGRDPSSDVADCVEKKVVRWKFPKPRDGQPVPVQFPLVFATIED